MQEENINRQKRSGAGKWMIFVTVLVILGSGAYWFGYRPTEIKKDCDKYAMNHSQGLRRREYAGTNRSGVPQYNYISTSAQAYTANYESCLHEKGL